MFFELSIVLLHDFYNVTECCFVTVVSEVFTTFTLYCVNLCILIIALDNYYIRLLASIHIHRKSHRATGLLADVSAHSPVSGRSHAVDSGPVTLCGLVALYLLQ